MVLITWEGLHEAFGKQDNTGYCAIGSIKSNIGHLTAAAGVAGFIKTVLSMNHHQIPASLGFSEPNPAINFEDSPFFVNAKLREWKSDKIRRAGISSFGVGGTNVHLVLEEYVMKPKTSGLGRPMLLLPWSAKTKTSLINYQNELGNYLNNNASVSLADVSYSLKITRDSFKHRQFIIGNDVNEVTKNLLTEVKNTSNSSQLNAVPSELAFLFPGQGAQYLQMGKSLYEHETIFREAIDVCSELLLDNLKLDIRNIIFPKSETLDAQEKLQVIKSFEPEKNIL